MWNIIAANKIKDSVWDEIDDTKLEIDKEFLEKNFSK